MIAWLVTNKANILAVITVILFWAIFAVNFPGLTEMAAYAAAGWYWLGGVVVPAVEKLYKKLLA